MRVILLAIGLMTMVTGCGTAKPYVAVGIGYQLDNMTDWMLRTEREWACENPDVFHGEVGVEWPSKVTLGYHHQSHVSCGGPFNNKPETYRDEIIIRKQWGGY